MKSAPQRARIPELQLVRRRSPRTHAVQCAKVAASGIGQAIMVYSASELNQDAPIGLVNLRMGGASTVTQIGQGSLAEVYIDKNGGQHAAWCSSDGAVSYASPDGATGKIAFPPCLSRPGLFQDAASQMHLIWYSDQVENNFTDRSTASLIYESIQTANGWSEPAIVASTVEPTMISTANAPDGTSFLA